MMKKGNISRGLQPNKYGVSFLVSSNTLVSKIIESCCKRKAMNEQWNVPICDRVGRLLFRRILRQWYIFRSNLL